MKRSTLQRKVSTVSRIATRAASGGQRTAQEAAEREHRRLQDRCEALREQLEASEHQRAELFSLVSHDLKNPLSPLLMSAQVLTRSIPPETPGRHSAEIIRRSADELSLMLEALSDASGIEQGRLSVRDKLAATDVGGMIAEALETTRRRAQDRLLEVTIAEDLPPASCDRHRMVRVLADLVIRALRITPKGETVTVQARLDRDGDAVLSITDGGPSIPEEYRRLFFELPTSARHQRATGQEFALALFVARGVVEAHGGAIDVASAGARGSTVSLTLPGRAAAE